MACRVEEVDRYFWKGEACEKFIARLRRIVENVSLIWLVSETGGRPYLGISLQSGYVNFRVHKLPLSVPKKGNKKTLSSNSFRPWPITTACLFPWRGVLPVSDWHTKTILYLGAWSAYHRQPKPYSVRLKSFYCETLHSWLLRKEGKKCRKLDFFLPLFMHYNLPSLYLAQSRSNPEKKVVFTPQAKQNNPCFPRKVPLRLFFSYINNKWTDPRRGVPPPLGTSPGM